MSRSLGETTPVRRRRAPRMVCLHYGAAIRILNGKSELFQILRAQLLCFDHPVSQAAHMPRHRRQEGLNRLQLARVGQHVAKSRDCKPLWP